METKEELKDLHLTIVVKRIQEICWTTSQTENLHLATCVGSKKLNCELIHPKMENLERALSYC